MTAGLFSMGKSNRAENHKDIMIFNNNVKFRVRIHFH